MTPFLAASLVWGSCFVPGIAWASPVHVTSNSEAAVDDGAYRVGADDTLAIQVYGEPELSGTFPVGASGEVDFPLVGAVAVTGLTVSQIAEALRARLAPAYVARPSVSVSVAEWRSQPVQVLGAVTRPGTMFLRGPTSVLEAIGQAGGLVGPGVDEVRLTRATGETRVLRFEALLRGEDVTLAAGDVVVVPRSVVAVLGDVDQPGEVAWRDGLTISQSIASAGGALPTADMGRIDILRGEARIRVNLRRILAGRAPDVPVLPGDRVFVRESPV